MILRGLVGSTTDSREEASQAHAVFVQGWKDAVEIAEKLNEDGYWPVHVNGKYSFGVRRLARKSRSLIFLFSSACPRHNHFFRIWRNRF